MAIDSNGIHYEYRTLQFYGVAYGDSNVSLTTTINGNILFSGAVSTINSPLPISPVETTDAILFTLPDSLLFPTNWYGMYPVNITVSGGYGAIFTKIKYNYPTINSGAADFAEIITDPISPFNDLKIDNVEQPLPENLPGSFHHYGPIIVPSGSTISFNCPVPRGLEDISMMKKLI
jgi:hypothetical protein